MTYVPPITDTPVFHQQQIAGATTPDTAELDAFLVLLRDTLNLLLARDPLSTNADGTPLTSTVSSATAATVLAALAGTGGAALIGTLQPGATVEAALASLVTQVTALNLIPQADLIKRTGTVPFTANQPMGNHKITGLAAGSASGEAVNYDQLQAVAAGVISASGALRRDGSVSALADLPMGTWRVVNAGNAAAAQDLTTLSQVQAALRLTSPVGEMKLWPSAAIPTGYLLCDGTAISRSTYATLFALIGTQYGVGDGTTTFNLPDGRGRAMLGSGTGSGLTSRVLGTNGGEETHVLTIPELAAHTHTANGGASQFVIDGGATVYQGALNAGQRVAATDSTGSGTGHNNMQPFWVGNTIIRVTAITL